MKKRKTASTVYYRYIKTIKKYRKIYEQLSEIISSERLDEVSEKVLKHLLRKLSILYKRLKRLLTLGKVSTAALTTAFILLTGNVSAQSFSEVTGSGNPFDGVDVGYYNTPAFADLDGDGDLDAFIGEFDGNVNYYENTGTAESPVFSEITGSGNPFDGVDVGQNSTLAFADLDADGDLDAFIGDRDGNINYYENTGTAESPFFSEVTGSGNPFDGVDVGEQSAPAFADLDGDGDLDAFIGEDDGVINYYENTGTAESPFFSEVTGSGNPFDGVDVGFSSKAAFADLDGDGDLDAFIGELAINSNYYENMGTAVSPLFSAVTGSSNPLNGVSVGNSTAAFADLDGDGDLDAFIGEFEGNIHYYENSYTAAASSFRMVEDENDPFDGVDVGTLACPAFADIDGDGDFDVFVGQVVGTISYYENTGTLIAPVYSAVTGSGNPLNGVDVGDYSIPIFEDIDGDGDLDVFIGAFLGTISYYENTGTATSPAFSPVTGSSNPLNGLSAVPSFADLDGDGDLDAFLGQNDGTLDYYENTGTALSPSFSQVTGSGNPFDGVDLGFYNIPAFADIDGDGDLDAFMGEQDGLINYYENTGTKTSPVFSPVTGSGNPFDGESIGTYAAPAFADIDGDGDVDAIIGDIYGFITTYVNNETTLPVELSSFTGNYDGEIVELNWSTATEVNNYGFDIERQAESGGSWSKVGFVAGSGVENAGQNYTFTDTTTLPAVDTVSYRLKQIDNDGAYEYSKTVEVVINNSTVTGIDEDGVPTEFGLSQNYPNPFNPTTTISYRVPESSNVTLKVYDMLGREVATLVNENKSAGYYTINLNASNLASGMYIYSMTAGEFVQTKKMVLLK